MIITDMNNLSKSLRQINVVVDGTTFQYDSPINGIALSPDGQTFFYSALS